MLWRRANPSRPSRPSRRRAHAVANGKGQPAPPHRPRVVGVAFTHANKHFAFAARRYAPLSHTRLSHTPLHTPRYNRTRLYTHQLKLHQLHHTHRLTSYLCRPHRPPTITPTTNHHHTSHNIYLHTTQVPGYVACFAASLAYAYTGLSLGLFGIAVGALFPLPSITGLPGRFGVGFVDYEFADKCNGTLPAEDANEAMEATEGTEGADSRRELYRRRRPLIGRVFYPTAPHTKTAGYLYQDSWELTRCFFMNGTPPALKRWIPSFLLSHWANIRLPISRGAMPSTSPTSPTSPTPSMPSVFSTPLGGGGGGRKRGVGRQGGPGKPDSKPTTDGRFPVVVFSHGLTATRETSSSLALSLAAAGAVVVCVEHSDGSSSLARFKDADDGTPVTLHYDNEVAGAWLR